MKSGMLAAVVFALAPMAHAQGCGALNKVLAAAPARFDAVLGEEIDDDYFNASVWVDGNANGCWVDLTISDLYVCGWNFGSQAHLDARYAELTSAARACLAGWTEKDGSGSDPDNPGKKRVEFSGGPGANAKTTIAFFTRSISADRHSIDFEVKQGR